MPRRDDGPLPDPSPAPSDPPPANRPLTSLPARAVGRGRLPVRSVPDSSPAGGPKVIAAPAVASAEMAEPETAVLPVAPAAPTVDGDVPASDPLLLDTPDNIPVAASPLPVHEVDADLALPAILSDPVAPPIEVAPVVASLVQLEATAPAVAAATPQERIPWALLWALRVVLVGGALALGWMGQQTLDTARQINPTGPPPPTAWQLFAAGAVLLALGAWSAPLVHTAVPARARALWAAHPRRKGALALGVAAILSGLAAVPVFAEVSAAGDLPGTNIGPGNIAWGLFLLSLLLAGGALVLWEGRGRGGSPARSADPLPDQLPPWVELALGVGLLVLGLAFRVPGLDHAPPGLWFDEAQNGIVARSLVGLDMQHPIFISARTQMGAFFFYIMGAALQFSGPSIVVVRLFPAIAGAVAGVLLYVLASRLYGWRVGLLAGGLLAVSTWSITFSRFGIVTNVSVMLDLAVLTCIVLGLRSGRLGWYGLAGLLFGLNLHMYYGVRLLPLVIGAVFLHKLVSERWRFVRGIRWGAPLFALTTLLAFLPMGVFAVQHPDDFNGRINDVSVFRMGPGGTFDTVAARESLIKHLLMFNWLGDGNARHNIPTAPMLDTLVGALFVLGVGYCLIRSVRWQFFFPLVWGFVVMLGGVLSLPFEAPQAHRTLENSVVTALLAGLALGQALTVLTRPRPRPQAAPEPADEDRAPAALSPPAPQPAPVPDGARRRLLVRAGQAGALIAALAVIAVTGKNAYAHYFEQQVNLSSTWQDMYTAEYNVAELINQYSATHDLYVSPIYLGLPPQVFLTAPEQQPHEYPGEWAIPLEEASPRPWLFIINPPTAGDVARIARLYPHAVFDLLRAPLDSRPLQYRVFIPPQDQAAIHGVEVRLTAPGAGAEAAPLVERVDPLIDHQWGAGDPAPSFRVQYTATLRLAASEQLRFYLEGNPPNTQITVDGYPADTPRLLGAGLHRLTVATGVQVAGERTRLLMSTAVEGGTPVTAGMLFKPQVEPHGLTGYYYRGADVSSNPALVRVDPVVSFYVHRVPVDRPYTVEWRGKLFIPTDGPYGIGIEQISQGTVEIDGKLLINNPSDNNYMEQQLTLQRGFHSIRIVWKDLANYSHVYLQWLPPGRERSIIPSYFLWPEQASYPDPNAGGVWPTLEDTNGQRLPPGFEQHPPAPGAPAPVPGAPAPTAAPPPPPPVPSGLTLPPTTAASVTQVITLEAPGDPRSMAVDAAGNLYVLTGDEGKIHKFGPDGKELASWPVVDLNGKQALEPFSLVIQDTQLRVLDAGTANLLTYDLAGKLVSQVQACTCYAPRGLLAEADGSLLVADTGIAQLRQVSTQGVAGATIGERGTGPGQFVEPTGLWRAPDGTLFVVDSGNNRVQRLSRSGTFEAQWPIMAGIAREGARITGDAAGHIYVTLTDLGLIAVYDRDGKALAAWQVPGSFAHPSAILTTAKGIYVADPLVHGVQVVTPLP